MRSTLIFIQLILVVFVCSGNSLSNLSQTAPFECLYALLSAWWYNAWIPGLFVSLLLILVFFYFGFRRYELKRVQARLEAQRLHENDIAKLRLYNNITHEFRTPLTVIMGMASELDKQPDVAKELIHRNGERLLNLINQMLSLAKLDSGKLQLKEMNGDIIPYLQYLTESFQSFAETKQIQLLIYKEVDELIMDYDAEKIQQVVTNLISNAIKFTPKKGKVILHVNARPERKAEKLILKVKDNGIGIEPAALPYIFDRFYQVDNSSVAKNGFVRSQIGTGIGLTLCRELVDLMKGEVKVKSRPGKGTEFTVILPVHQGAPKVDFEATTKPVIAVGRKEKHQANGTQLQKDKLPILLFIEDNEDVVTYLRVCLQGRYTVDWAADGAIGIQKALETIPDIIISDVMMPEKDGFEVCQALKNDERSSHIPIVILTAKEDVTSRLMGLGVGADAYLSKPFMKEELMVRLEQLVELRKALQKKYGGSGLENIYIPLDEKPELESLFLMKMKRIVENRLDDADFNISQFCRDAGMSRAQLHRKLKALTDKSATRFIRTIRLLKARDLLQKTDMNISEIAYRTGFRTPAYFSTCFFKEFRVNPGETRK